MPVTRRSEANPDLDQAVRNLRAACVSRAWAYRPDVLAVLAVLEENVRLRARIAGLEAGAAAGAPLAEPCDCCADIRRAEAELAGLQDPAEYDGEAPAGPRP